METQLFTMENKYNTEIYELCDVVGYHLVVILKVYWL